MREHFRIVENGPGRSYVFVTVLLGILCVHQSVRAQELRCSRETRSGVSTTQWHVSVGALVMPVGAFLLVRSNGRLGALRITSVEPAAGSDGTSKDGPYFLGRSNYESLFLPENTRAFTATNVVHGAGDIDIGETVGIHAIYLHQKGHNKVKIGPWTLSFFFPTMLSMSPPTFWKGPHDQGFEFAPTSACQASEIDATDKRLRWFRWDKTTQVTLPLVSLPPAKKESAIDHFHR